MKELDKNWESIAPRLLQYYYSIPKSKHSEVARVVRQYYLGDKSINKENLLNLTHMVGDRIFGTDSVKAAKLQAKANNSPVWYYYFTYRPDYSLSELLSGSKENFGNSFFFFFFLSNDFMSEYFNKSLFRSRCQPCR